MGDERKAGALLSYLYIGVNTLVVLVYQKIVLQTLGSSEFGLYQLAASIINYMSVMDLGFGNGIVTYTARYRATGKDREVEKLHGMFLLIFCGIGIVAMGVGAFITFNVDWMFGASMTAEEIAKSRILMAILTVNMGATFVLSIYNNIIIACERFIFVKVITILRALLNPLIMLPLLYLGGDSITMVTVLVAVNIACLLANLFFCTKKLGIKVRYRGFDKGIFMEIFSYSIFIFIAEIVDKVNWCVDQIILGVVKGTKEVTVYSMASNYNQLVLQFSAAVSSVMLPRVSAMVARKEGDAPLNTLFIKASRVQIYTVFLIVSGFTLVGREFVLWHAGKECIDSYATALILMGAAMIPITQSVAISIIKAKDKFKFRAFVLLAMAVLNFGISIPLAMAFGSIGSAAGTAIGLLIANIIVMNIYYHKSCGINMAAYWRTFVLIVVRYLPCMAAVYVISAFYPISGLWGVLLYGGLYIVLYFISTYFLVMNGYEKGLVRRYISKVLSVIK